MKTSELIRLLQRNLEKDGDMDVDVYVNDLNGAIVGSPTKVETCLGYDHVRKINVPVCAIEADV